MKPFTLYPLNSAKVAQICKTCTSCRHTYEDLTNEGATYVIISRNNHIFRELRDFMNEFDGLDDIELEEMIENLAGQSYNSIAAMKEAEELDKQLRAELKRREEEYGAKQLDKRSLAEQLSIK